MSNVTIKTQTVQNTQHAQSQGQNMATTQAQEQGKKEVKRKLTQAEKVQQLEARLAQQKAKLNEENRRKRTSRLIACGNVLEMLFFSSQAEAEKIFSFMKQRKNEKNARTITLAMEYLELVYKKRNEEKK